MVVNLQKYCNSWTGVQQHVKYICITIVYNSTELRRGDLKRCCNASTGAAGTERRGLTGTREVEEREEEGEMMEREV
jgi:hypothetical protein